MGTELEGKMEDSGRDVVLQDVLDGDAGGVATAFLLSSESFILTAFLISIDGGHSILPTKTEGERTKLLERRMLPRFINEFFFLSSLLLLK